EESARAQACTPPSRHAEFVQGNFRAELRKGEVRARSEEFGPWFPGKLTLPRAPAPSARLSVERFGCGQCATHAGHVRERSVALGAGPTAAAAGDSLSSSARLRQREPAQREEERGQARSEKKRRTGQREGEEEEGEEEDEEEEEEVTPPVMSALNYSKWDHIELSDDEDIECHPNVDKKSLIRWKQQEIHRQREERNAKIKDLTAETETNVVLLGRLESLLSEMPRALSSSAAAESPVAAVNRSSDELKAAGERPDAARHAPGAPAYDTMVAALLVQIASEATKEAGAGEGGAKPPAEEDDPTRRARQAEAILKKLEEHKAKLVSRQQQALEELLKTKKEAESKLSVDDLCKPGFDCTVTFPVAFSASLQTDAIAPAGSTGGGGDDDDEEEEDIVTSDVAREFSKLDSLEKSFAFISKHPYIVSESKSDEILAAAFEAQMLGKEKTARRFSPENGFTVAFCTFRLLYNGCPNFPVSRVPVVPGRRMAKPGKALDMFSKDVHGTYTHIQKRCKILKEEKAAKAAEGGGRETIQLFTPDASKPINFQLPTEDTNPAGLAIFNAFPQEFREALVTKDLEKVNKVLGNMECAEAE
ncbi:MAG: Cdc37 N terminal kinase binding-domain-containing protein, partial [Olpidium bornovanus]